MKSKNLSLFIIVLIYLAAFGTGGAVLWAVPPFWHPLAALFAADVAATIVVFVFNLAFKNASVYDPYWSVQPVIVIAAMYFFYGAPFQLIHLLILVPLLLWSVRLTLNWTKNFENMEWEDWRYRKYKKDNPRIAQFIVFTGIMLMPTILVFLGTVPYWYILQAEKLSSVFPAIGGMVILIGTLFEHLADTSMRRYKKNQNRGHYIDEGLWRYSRHPNYLGEIMIWIGLFIAGLSNFHCFSIFGAVSITLLFTCISIPMMEKHVLEKHPEYIEYKKTVCPLIFGPRKKK